MLVSKHLLTKFLPQMRDITHQQFNDACTTVGLEIEDIKVHPKLENFIIGQIIDFEKHPNADKLHVCQVKIHPNGQTNTIVCGASNLVKGKKVIVALKDAKLFNGLTIEYKEIRSILSQGMLCAYRELTPHTEYCADVDNQGIILLDDAIVGDTAVGKYVGLDDEIYELAVPLNRNDLNGVIPICQELAGYFKWAFNLPVLEQAQGNFQEDIKLDYDAKLATGLCAIKAKNVPSGLSNWLAKSLLMNNGIKPINRVVDMLAYVTLITSVPTAVYDANKIKNQLKIQLAPKPTTIVGINKNTYHLTNQDLVVSCEGQILSIAGIIGNEAFAITDNTKDIIIEVANFNHLLIRNSANRLSLHTNAANRFAKPISNYLIFLTLHFIYQQFAGYAISQPNINIKPREQKVVDIDVNLINQLLDTSLTIPVIQQNLKYYGFVAKDNALVVPPYRLDITTSQDLSEEITKFLVINEITPKPVNGDLTKDNNNTVYRLYSKLEDILAVNYFSQVKTYNLVSETDLSNFNIFKYTNFIKITNANNQSRQYLRTNLIHNLLKVYEFNLSYKTPIQPIFEIQNIYTSKTYKNLTLLTPSVKFINRLNDSKIKYDINVLRGIVDLIANVFNAKFDYFTSLDNPYFYPNEMLTINFAGQLIGYIGLIKTSELKPYGLNDQLIYGVTINLEMLFDLYTPPQIQFSPINDLMPIYKDISFYVSPTTRINNALATIKKLPFVQHYDFIDRFVNQKGEISYTIRFELINTKNLKAIEIDQYYQQIISILIEFNCVVRR